MNFATSSFAAKFEAAAVSESWQLAFEKFSFRLANRESPPHSRRPDQRGRAKGTRTDRLQDICDRYQAARTELEAALAARRAFLERLEKQHGPRLRRVSLVNSGRLLLPSIPAAGPGRAGLSWDRITGLPVVPGAALKGLVGTWMRRKAREAAPPQHPAQGQTRPDANPGHPVPPARQAPDEESSTRAACPAGILFLGAWPRTVPGLTFSASPPRTDEPGSGRDRVRGPFLTIDPGNEWEFVMLAAGTPPDEEAITHLDAAERWLREALAEIGLGDRAAPEDGRFLTAVRWAAAKAAVPPPARPAREAEPRPASPPAGDYANEAIFANRVLKNLNPGAVAQIEVEIEKLRKSENAPWRARLIEALRGNDMRNVRKRLKEKPWFPQDWLPQ